MTDGPLSAQQSDRLFRAGRLLDAAEGTFRNKTKAGAWLRRRNAALDGLRPLDLLDTEEGARRAEALLARIARGYAA